MYISVQCSCYHLYCTDRPQPRVAGRIFHHQITDPPRHLSLIYGNLRSCKGRKGAMSIPTIYRNLFLHKHYRQILQRPSGPESWLCYSSGTIYAILQISPRYSPPRTVELQVLAKKKSLGCFQGTDQRATTTKGLQESPQTFFFGP